MVHLPEGAKELFVGLNNVALLAVPIRQRMVLNNLVPPWWTCNVECASVYPMQKPWLYMYYARHIMNVGIAKQRTEDQVSLDQFVKLVVQTIIESVLWGMWIVYL